jgi:hypothetical protein
MLKSLLGARGKDVARMVQVYFGDASTIVAPMHCNASAVYFEQVAVLTIVGQPSPIDLGNAFAEAFALFSPSARDPSQAKRSDWPAFKASGCSSIKDFESRYLPVACSSLSASNAVVRASTPHPAGAGLEIALHFNPQLPAHAIGEGLIRLMRAARSA